jgi:hypothetical protein
MPELGSLEPLVASGHPLHTRTLSVESLCSDAARLRVEGSVLDLRKCGFVPTGGDLQTAGVIHHMQLALEVEAAGARILGVETAQPTVAFEPSAATGGESCRDPVPRLQALVGERLDAGFPRRLAAVFGGPAGCSHLLTLAQLMGASAARVLGAGPALAERAAGERVAKRVLVLDGFEPPAGGLEVAIQLSEFETRPFVAVGTPLERLARQHELRVLARLDRGLQQIELLDAVERERGPGSLAAAAWRSRSETLAGLVGAPALRGLAGRVLAQLGDAPGEQPLRDALLNLAPGVIQCFAALSHRLVGRFETPVVASELPRELSVGGFPDSCYMWRSGGAMARARFAPRRG